MGHLDKEQGFCVIKRHSGEKKEERAPCLALVN